MDSQEMFHAGYDPAAGAVAQEEWMSFGDSDPIAEILSKKRLLTLVRPQTLVYQGEEPCLLPWMRAWWWAWGSPISWRQPCVAHGSAGA